MKLFISIFAGLFLAYVAQAFFFVYVPSYPPVTTIPASVDNAIGTNVVLQGSFTGDGSSLASSLAPLSAMSQLWVTNNGLGDYLYSGLYVFDGPSSKNGVFIWTNCNSVNSEKLIFNDLGWSGVWSLGPLTNDFNRKNGFNTEDSNLFGQWFRDDAWPVGMQVFNATPAVQAAQTGGLQAGPAGPFDGSALTNLSCTGGSFTNTLPVNFTALAKIQDPLAQADLNGMWMELNTSPFVTNLVDGVLLHPRFNPTNGLTFMGRTMLLSNLTFSGIGAQFQTSSVTVYGLPDLRTNCTLFVVKRTVNSTLSRSEFIAGVENTNTFSAMAMGGQNGSWRRWWTRAATNQYFSNGATNAVLPFNGYGGYADIAESYFTRHEYGNGISGGTNLFAYDDVSEAQINYFNPQLGGQVITNLPDPLTCLRIGQDFYQEPFSGPYKGNMPLTGTEIECVFVFNCPISTNLMRVAGRMADWICPDTTISVWDGDSRFCCSSATIWGQTAPNSETVMLQKRFYPNQLRTRLLPVGGTYLTASGTPWISVLGEWPYHTGHGLISKITRADWYDAHGINDIYQGGSSVQPWPTTLASVTNLAALVQSNGYVFHWVAPYTTGTNNASYYSVSGESNRVALISNAVCNTSLDVQRQDLLVSQSMMSNTNLGYSLDGLHIYSTNELQFLQFVSRNLQAAPAGTTFSLLDGTTAANNYFASTNSVLMANSTIAASQISPTPLTSLPTGLVTNNGTAGIVATNGSQIGGLAITNNVITGSGTFTVNNSSSSFANAIYCGGNISSPNGEMIPTKTQVPNNCAIGFSVDSTYYGTLGAAFSSTNAGIMFLNTNLTVRGSSAMIPIAAYAGTVCTNGVGAMWNSNGVWYLRWSAIGATTWTDKPLTP